MDKEKAKKLEMRGWKIGDASDFLGLTQEESVYVDLKVGLALKLRDQRKRKRLTQTALAQAIGSSQSRIAKMEGGRSDGQSRFTGQISAHAWTYRKRDW